MRDVLALASKFGTWSETMCYAGDLAAALGGSLTGIYVSEPVPTMGMPVAYPEFLTIAADMAREAAESTPLFESWANRRGIARYRWQVAQGRVEPVLARMANWHDVLVLEAGADAMFGTPEILGTLLLTSGIACIIVPERCVAAAIPETVMVAWNCSPEAMRATRAALPLLSRAGRVVLVDGEDAMPRTAIAWHPPLDIGQYLSTHGIHVERLRFEANRTGAGSGLLAAAAEYRADLLVMGAYGHTRFGEWVFGGATEFVLRNCSLPVLFCH